VIERGFKATRAARPKRTTLSCRKARFVDLGFGVGIREANGGKSTLTEKAKGDRFA
jgi:hypothetical protein